MGFFGVIKISYRKIFKFSSRSSRSEYWYFSMFFSFLYMFGLYIENTIMGGGLLEKLTTGEPIISQPIISLFTTVPLIALTVRRLHDVNRSGWWFWLALTIIGLIPLYYWLGFKKSDENENDYGSNPLKVDPNEQDLNDLKSSITLKILFVLLLVITVMTLFSTIYLSTTQNKVTSIGQLVINDAKKLANSPISEPISAPILNHGAISDFTKILTSEQADIFVNLKSITKKNNNRTAWFMVNNKAGNQSEVALLKFNCASYEFTALSAKGYAQLNAKGEKIVDIKDPSGKFVPIKPIPPHMIKYATVCGSKLKLKELKNTGIPEVTLSFDSSTIQSGMGKKIRAWYSINLPDKDPNNSYKFMSFTFFNEIDCQNFSTRTLIINGYNGKNLNKYLHTSLGDNIQAVKDALNKQNQDGTASAINTTKIEGIAAPAICKAA